MKVMKMKSPAGVDIFGLYTDLGAPVATKQIIYGGKRAGVSYFSWDDLPVETVKALFSACADCEISNFGDWIDGQPNNRLDDSAWNEYRALLAKIA